MSKFQAVSAPKLPRLACVGTIASIGQTKASKSGTYNVTEIVIEALGGGTSTKTYLLTRPEWLAPGFTPDVELEGNSGAMFVYKRNIQGPSGSPTSTLIGLSGSEEASEALVDKIFAAVTTVNDGEGETSIVTEADLDKILQMYVGTTVGYVLSQRMEDVGVDENGKKLKVRTANYEFDQFFFPTEASLKRYRKLAESKPADWRVGFDA